MKKQIIADSCCDLSEALKAKMDIVEVPLTIRANGKLYVDDETLDTLELIAEMKSSQEPPSTSCPSPDDFIKSYDAEKDSFVVTLSSELSGTYNSAVLAKQIFQEEHKESFIHVFNSKSASVGETMISLKLQELINKGLENSEVVEQTEAYIEEMKTYFILESLDNLIKAGRISRFKGKLASLLSIVPIMKATDAGEIDLSEKVRGAKKAFGRLVEIIGEQGSSFEEKILGIAHCNCFEKALKLKSEIERAYNFKEIVIVETQGISTVYANDGGIVIAF
ncbi:DegV domain-containing protein [Andreesenia angusta]|uniref:DegV domain-containing protein n=1 Tax=Andreesenia angusta TaxID=39480 RepID=A0A1S1V572_9FIRM|nr:DegV family protein [Andreesenia angusta]OHW61811.1 DegV domain-containing protein [Andreesenia angusta]